MVVQNIRQLKRQKIAMRLTRRSAVLSLASSALHPDLRMWWNTSIFHRSAYQFSFSIASSADFTSRLVMSFQTTGAR